MFYKRLYSSMERSICRFTPSPILSLSPSDFESHDNCLPAFNALNYSLSHPGDTRTAFEIGHNSPTDFYTWLETHPVQGAAFHRFMEAQFASLPTWLDVVDFSAEFANSTTSESPVFVDVGGGNGQQV